MECPFFLAHEGTPCPPTSASVFLLSDGSVMTIGRNHDCDVKLFSSNPNICMMVSRNHAKLWFDPGSQCVWIMDLASVNGVFVNGKRLPKETGRKLNENDLISFGQERLEDFLYRVKRRNLNDEIPKEKKDQTIFNRSPTVAQRSSSLAPSQSLLLREREEHQKLVSELENAKRKQQELESQVMQFEYLETILKAKIEILETKVRSLESTSSQVQQHFEKKKQKLKDILECPICFDVPPENNVVLRCGHSVFAKCLKNLKAKKKTECPICNVKALDRSWHVFVLDKLSVTLFEEEITLEEKISNQCQPNLLNNFDLNTAKKPKFVDLT